MRILHRGPEHCFQYHLICSLYLVNISMTGVHSGICAKYLYRVSTNVVKFLTFVKDTIISEVNLQNLQVVKFYPCYSVSIVNIS